MNHKQNDVRQPYEKPQLMKVQLVPEEAVLAACKIDGIFNAFGSSGHCGLFFQCNQAGS